MTTLKPQLVRADTLDLQDHDAPSAKDHTRQPTHPSPYGQGPAAPHQTQALRNAEHEAHNEQNKSPRVSEDQSQTFPEEPNFFDDPDDELENERMMHDGSNEAAGDGHNYDDNEQLDDDLDDDLMDKISSSPSIDDGKYTLPIWPFLVDSMESGATYSPSSTPTRGAPSSSPFTSPPDHFPLPVYKEVDKPTSHQFGEYSGDCDSERTPQLHNNPKSSNQLDISPDGSDEDVEQDYANIEKYLLPVDDPLLDNSFDEYGNELCDNNESDWEDEDECAELQDHSSIDDDTGNFDFTDDPRFLDSGWGGECLREIEDIDFEFVYALHTFVATVEGQANATKGDTMVLLDDSNSYWWLVRVVKDGSIGYLPAEHIETPTERLARLNKHRNIDLSATMLGDNPEKSKNPLKKAMRRRNAKTVQFAPPTYFEPSDYEYSDEEEEEEEESQLQQGESAAQAEEPDQVQDDKPAVVAPAPLAINTQQNGPSVNGVKRITSDESLDSDIQTSPVIVKPSDVPPAAVAQAEDTVNRSRKGNVRNTDSFFKDDSVETKKISLTPRLLRGDSEASLPIEQDARQRPSLETFDQMIGPDDRPKDDKKKKEKKGMLSGLFRRKEKNVKGSKNDSDDAEKVSEESIRFAAPSKDSFDSLVKSDASPERRPSKLQKQQPITSPKASPIENKPFSKELTPTSPVENASIPAPTGPAPAPPSLRPIQTDQQYQNPNSQQKATSPIEKKSIFAPITTVLKSSSSNSSFDPQDSAVKPIYSKRAKNRFAIDDSDSEDDMTPTTDHHHRSISPIGQSHELEHSDSPMRVSPIQDHDEEQSAASAKPAPLALDTSRSAYAAPELQASPASAIHVRDSDAGTNTTKASPSSDAPTPSTSRSTPTWSDASLRSYMDNDQGMKDLLIIIHDNSTAAPAGPDHPLVGSLFMNERSRLAEMQSNLDSLLTGWISKKNASLLSR